MRCPRSEIEKRVLEKVRPKPEERVKAERIWRYVRERLEEILEAHGINAEVTLQGSLAKDTWLSGELDIDVFVLFPMEWKKRLESAKELFKKAFQGLPIEERYAAHPYIRVLVEDVWVDVVPALRVPSGDKAETAVDRTPFHTSYIRSKLDEEQRDEVRLLKRFLKGIGVYGAEIAVQGFSGYLAELLVVEFGCFRSILEKAARWRPPIILDPEKHYGGVVEELMKRFEGAPLIVVDPVDPRRNVAAAVSMRSLAIFVLAARLYTLKPSLLYFWPPEPPVEREKIIAEAGPRAWSIVAAVYNVEGESPDVAWGRLKATLRRVESFMRERGVQLIDGIVAFCEDEGRGFILVELEFNPPPFYRLHAGPRVWDEIDRVVKFVERNARIAVGPWVGEDAALYALRPVKLDVSDVFRRAARGLALEAYGPLADVIEKLPWCSEARRRIYEYVKRRPLWLEAFIGG